MTILANESKSGGYLLDTRILPCGSQEIRSTT